MNDYSDPPPARRRPEARAEKTWGTLKGVALMMTFLALAAGRAALEARFGQFGAQPIVMAAGEFLPCMESAPELAGPLRALRAALRDAGREMARTGRIPEDMRARLNRPVIDWAGVTTEEYRRFGNEAFRQALKALDPAASPGP